MNEKESFIYSNLEKKSNAIVGFIILQSLFLADKLSNTDFKDKIKEMIFLHFYIIYAHIFILLLSVIFLFLINKKMNQNLGDLKKEIYSTPSSIIKICLVILFGLIPLFVLLNI